MSKYFKSDATAGDEVECKICYSILKDPVELVNCQHTFCLNCIEDCKAAGGSCPLCRGPVEEYREPNKVIIGMINRLKGSCSLCSWKGTHGEFLEKHKVCPGEASKPKESVGPQKSEMASTNLNSVTRMVAIDDPSSPHTSSHVKGSKGSLHFSEFGMTKDEFEFLLAEFPNFSTATSSDDEPALRWRDAFRFLRYCNYPHSLDDVQGLFDMAHQSPSSGCVSFEGVCLWIALNRRSEQEWYSLPKVIYDKLLGFAHIIDTEKTGLFSISKAQMIAEEYFERSISPSEWSLIAECFSGEESMVSVDDGEDVTFSFHQILLALQKYTQKRNRSEAFKKRIRKTIEYYEPEALPQIDAIMEHHLWNEEEFLLTLLSQYGPEP